MDSLAEGPLESANNFRLSLVVAMYNEEAMVRTFFDHIVPIVAATTPDYEIVCVNDGSVDRTWELLQDEREANPKIKIVDLTRNFGKEFAMTAGIDLADGDAVIPIDADLQDTPELIGDMVAKWQEGYDMVLAVRSNRDSDSLLKRRTANAFYKTFSSMSEVPIPANAGDFRLMDRAVVEALKRMPERNRFMKGMFAWLGFKQTTLTYTRQARVAGESKWKYWRLWNFALDGILSFSTLPLRIWTYAGLLVAIVASIYMTVIIGRTLIFGVDVPGYASLTVIMLFFSGMNMIGLGVLGEYIGRIFIETKRRPLYLVRKTMGFDSRLSPHTAEGSLNQREELVDQRRA